MVQRIELNLLDNTDIELIQSVVKSCNGRIWHYSKSAYQTVMPKFIVGRLSVILPLDVSQFDFFQTTIKVF